MHGLQDLRVSTHSKIIIGAPDRDLLVLGAEMSSWELLGQTIDVIEVAVRLVLVLLVQLGSIKSLIVKLRSLWRSRLSSGGDLGGLLGIGRGLDGVDEGN